ALRLEVDDRIAGEDTLLRGFLDSLVDGRDELVRNHAARDRVRELVTGSARQRLDADVAVAELTVTARLLLVLALRFCRLAERLAIRNARLLRDDVDVILPLEPLDLDFEMQLAEAADDRLTQLGVVAELECRILLVQLRERVADLVLVAAAR